MVFTAPAVHYSALATQPPELSLSRSQQSIKHATSGRFRLSRIFKRLLYHDTHSEHTITTEIEEHIQLPGSAFDASETAIEGDTDDTSTMIKGLSAEQGLKRPIPSFKEPQERLPFTEPYFAVASNRGKLPQLELSTYHKHCIQQEKYIEQKQHAHGLSPVKQARPSSMNSSILTPIQEHRADLPAGRTPIMIDEQCYSKFSHQTSPSTENCIGLQYAVRKRANPTIRSSHAQLQTAGLRRLHSRPKMRSHSTANKSVALQKPLTPSTISSSIAHRIELLKQAMQNSALEVVPPPSARACPKEASSPSSIDTLHRQTQTNAHQSQPSEIHHIHHHHMHSSPSVPLEWRTYLSIIGTLILLLLLLVEFTTVNC